MERKTLIKNLKANVRLRIDDVAIETIQGTVRGKGRLHATKGKFHLRITLNEGQVFPKRPPGIYTRTDFYSLSGLIEDHLPFRAEIPPLTGWKRNNDVLQLRTTVSSIDLDATGWDDLTHKQIDQMLADQTESLPETIEEAVAEQPSAPLTVAEHCECHFSGFFKGLKLIAFNRQGEHAVVDQELVALATGKKSAYSGPLGQNFEYVLVQRKRGLEFHLKSLPGYQSTGSTEDIKFLSAFLSSIGLIYGHHPWPFKLEFRRNGRLMLDRVRPYTISPRTRFTAFNERLFHEAIMQHTGWVLNEPMQRAFVYFAQRAPMTRWISNFLFHMRESSKGAVHTKVSATVLCPLLENLVRTIAKELSLVSAEPAFATAKDKAVAALIATKNQLTDDGEKQAFDRLIGRSKSMEEWDAVQYFRAVANHFQLPWEPRWKEILRVWKEYRNLNLHTGSHDPDSDYRSELQVSSQIGGAINVLILKLMGYSGRVRWSAFNDDYDTI